MVNSAGRQKDWQKKVFQERRHFVLFSSEGYEAKELARISEISAGWLNRWERDGVIGLEDKASRGRKIILKIEDMPQIKRQVQENAQSLKIARQKLKAELGREFPTKT